MSSDIFNRSLEVVKAIVLKHAPHDGSVFLFGSFAQGKRRRSADIDVGFLGSKKIQKTIFYKIRDEIEETSIPFKVDLVDFYSQDESFKKIALQHTIPWKH